MAGQWRRDSDKRYKSSGRGIVKGGLKGVEERIGSVGFVPYDPNTESCSKCGVKLPPIKMVYDLCPACRSPPKKDLAPLDFTEYEEDKFSHSIHQLGKKPTFSEIKKGLSYEPGKLKSQINNKITFEEIKDHIEKEIIKNPKLRRSKSARDFWIFSFFREYDVSKQEKRRACDFLICRVTELNRK